MILQCHWCQGVCDVCKSVRGGRERVLQGKNRDLIEGWRCDLAGSGVVEELYGLEYKKMIRHFADSVPVYLLYSLRHGCDNETSDHD